MFSARMNGHRPTSRNFKDDYGGEIRKADISGIANYAIHGRGGGGSIN